MPRNETPKSLDSFIFFEFSHQTSCKTFRNILKDESRDILCREILDTI